jgi:hypothetical protein
MLAKHANHCGDEYQSKVVVVLQALDHWVNSSRAEYLAQTIIDGMVRCRGSHRVARGNP